MVGPIVGLIMGDVATGFSVGVSVEIMFLGNYFRGYRSAA
ncbi:PTS sugar transporter subunit IIC, partial [uncultured Trichococcus sp.]